MDDALDYYKFWSRVVVPYETVTSDTYDWMLEYVGPYLKNWRWGLTEGNSIDGSLTIDIWIRDPRMALIVTLKYSYYGQLVQ